jgi:ribosomal protein S18 acetylase RimI-like enzyme
MTSEEFRIEIKPAEESQLDMLQKVFDPTSLSKEHHQRYEVQKSGEGIYLIAWHKDLPVGHFLLTWSGPRDAHVTKYIDVAHSGYLLCGATIEGFQRRGVATRVIREAERLAKEQGCTRIGLEVASTDNPGAKRLYERLGYVDWGHGEYQTSWEYIDANGNRGTASETVTYMQKPL